MVLAADRPDAAAVWTVDGRRRLPEDAATVLGTDHPFLNDVARDLVAVCHQAHSGDFVICGFRADAPLITFANERGAHAGPGRQETEGFALLPESTVPTPHAARPYLRPLDLRGAALEALGRKPKLARPREHALRGPTVISARAAELGEPVR
jgi:hypothetical protein